MKRVVFFGMSGGFSTVPLAALATSGLAPVLVVRGLPRPAHRPRRSPASVEYRSPRSWLSRARGRTRASSPPTSLERVGERDLERAAFDLGIDVLSTTDANDPRSLRRIRSVSPDAFVVAGFPHLLSRDLLSLSKRGGLNVHPGKLPEERGPAPLFWALKDGRTTITFSIHVLDEGEDTGNIVSTGRLVFEPGADGEEILTECARRAAPQLLRALRGLLEGDLVHAPQPAEGAARRPRPAFRDGLIDTGKSAAEVFTFVAGCARTHSIFAECGGDRFFIKEAASFDPEASVSFEYVLTGDRLILRCAPGVVELVLKEQGAVFASEYSE